MIRPEEQRKVLTCPNCKAYQMHDYLRGHGQIAEEGSYLTGLESEVNRLQVALDATISEKERMKLRWIPVEERLPDATDGNYAGLILVFWDKWKMSTVTVQRMLQLQAEGGWNIAHWMPLPAPPKEASK